MKRREIEHAAARPWPRHNAPRDGAPPVPTGGLGDRGGGPARPAASRCTTCATTTREGMNADAGNGTGQHASTEQDAVSEPRQPPRNRT